MAWAVITKCNRVSGLNNKNLNLLLTVLQARSVTSGYSMAGFW